MENEIWVDVPGYEGLYSISSLGRIKSFYRHKQPFVKFHLNKKKYLMTFLYKQGEKRLSTLVHRLVAKTFIPNPENKPTVNHINGIKSDNRIENLEWMTCAENINHAIDTGLRDLNLRTQDMFSDNDLFEIRIMFNTGLKNPEIAKIYNCHHSTISKIRTGYHYPLTKVV